MVAFLCIITICAVALIAAYLVAVGLRSSRKPSRRGQMARIKQEADETVARLDASYHQALRDMRRHRR